MAAWRRYVLRPKKLDNKTDDGIVLALIFVILLTGFFVEGVRIAANPGPWDNYGFVGSWLAPLFQAIFTPSGLLAFHQFLWWFHMILAMCFIGYLPYSKLFHILLAPANQFLRKRGPIGIPEKIDFEDESLETYGKSQLHEFSWKTLFNTDVCLTETAED